MSAPVAGVGGGAATATATGPSPAGASVMGAKLASRSPVLAGVDFRRLLEGPALRASLDARPAAPAARPATRPPGHAKAQASASSRNERTRPRADSDEDDALDPLHRRRAALAPPSLTAHVAPVPLEASTQPLAPRTATPPASLEELMPSLVRRIAWSGDGRRGSVRIELGSGELAGGVLVVHADAGRVQVHLDVPSGVDAGQWQARLRAGLASRSIVADSVEVT